MGAVLDFSKFTFSAEEIRAVKELLWDEVIEAPEISLICTIFEGIVYDKEIGFIGKGGMVGVAQQDGDGDPVAQAFQIATRKVKWTPKGWEILIAQKRTDIEATAAVYSMKTGTSFNDFTSSDYMNIILESLTQSVKEFIIRLFWFNDTAADVIANGGSLTAGTEKKYFNIIDGFFKQLLVQTTANAKQKVTIAENAAATYVLQELVPANAKTYLQSLRYKAPLQVRRLKGAMIICTQSVYDAYELSLQGTAIESMYVNLIDGIKVLKIGGVPLFPVPIWDVIIETYYNTGVKLINPHRALFISKELLAAGVDSLASFGDMKTWYNDDQRKVKTEAMGKADAKLLNPALFQLAI
jgi:hypothetical protein